MSLPENIVVEPEVLGPSKRKKNPSTTLADYITTLLHEPLPSATPHPLDKYVSSSQFSENYHTYILAITSMIEPKHYNEAILNENWRFAIKDEIISLQDVGTFSIVDLPPGKKALGCKWVFRLKLRADGDLERHKAHLVIFGNNQKEGIEYNETFVPVAKMIMVQAFIQQVVSLD